MLKLISKIFKKTTNEMVAIQHYFEAYKTEFDANWRPIPYLFSPEEKKAYLFYLIYRIERKKLENNSLEELQYCFRYFDAMFYKEKNHAQLVLNHADWLALLDCFLMPETHKEGSIKESPYRFVTNEKNHSSFGLWVWDWAKIFKYLQTYCEQHGLSDEMRSRMGQFSELEKKQVYYAGSWDDKKSVAKTIREIYFYEENKSHNFTITPFLMEDDDWGKALNAELLTLTPQYRHTIYIALNHCAKSSGGKPTGKWLKEAENILKPIDSKWWADFLVRQFEAIRRIKTKETVVTYNYENGTQREYTTYEFLNKDNQDVLKGLVWTVQKPDKQMLTVLSSLVVRCYEKIPGVGPAAVSVGNAALWVMSNTEGLLGVNFLSRLRLRIKQANTQALIGKYLQEAATKNGMTTTEIEDLAADSFGLTEGVRVEEFGDFRAELHVLGIGKTEIRWFKADGTPQKSEPSKVKTEFAEELKALKNDAKQIQTSLTAQRDRIDRQFRLERLMPFEHFKNCYLEHGLVGFIAKKLIWNFKLEGNETKTGIWNGQNWSNTVDEGNPDTIGKGVVFDVPSDCQVQLWHPAQATVAEVQSWRNYLTINEIQQPIKQAHREVYWLTDAEVRTNTYSNRFAAHILKQHQFNSLAKLRDWKYSLLGCYDKGYDSEKAKIEVPERHYRAEFWVSEVNQDGEWNDTGIWNYVSTDQVRFYTMPTPENPRLDNLVPLSEVPTILFSELMRDVDMFVGVASVGNDPAWHDNGGLPQFRDYWQNYSFGELGETAKIRRGILEKLLPKLKIAKVASLDDKFLIVNGKLRTYKIHLGSTNILMSPNDQYLCIVPDRSKSKEENLFLPFEGDAGLSVIISKAFLLANDDKITDSTITSQINRK